MDSIICFVNIYLDSPRFQRMTIISCKSYFIVDHKLHHCITIYYDGWHDRSFDFNGDTPDIIFTVEVANSCSQRLVQKQIIMYWQITDTRCLMQKHLCCFLSEWLAPEPYIPSPLLDHVCQIWPVTWFVYNPLSLHKEHSPFKTNYTVCSIQ